MKRRPLSRFGLFVEGSNYVSANGRDMLVELWCDLVAWYGIPRDRIDVYGFSKSQIVAMSSNPNPRLRLPATEPLDIQIARAHDRKPFDVLIVAFDATPANQDLLPHKGCLHEIGYLLTCFVARRFLPGPLTADCRRLLDHYSHRPRPARTRQYSPRVDAVFMEPEFESLVVCDEIAVLRGVGHSKRPRGWPAFKKAQNPKKLLATAVEHATDDVRAQIRGDTKSNRHAWARRIIQCAGADSPIRTHSIVRHLQSLVA